MNNKNNSKCVKLVDVLFFFYFFEVAVCLFFFAKFVPAPPFLEFPSVGQATSHACTRMHTHAHTRT